MKKISIMPGIMALIFIVLSIANTHAGTPLWTFTPRTATTVKVPTNGTAVVNYRITNQSKKTHTLVLSQMPGVTQVLSGSKCPNPFTLKQGEFCTLSLNISGGGTNGNIVGGPRVCEQSSPLQCYQPSQANSLNVTLGPDLYTVGGNVYGLTVGNALVLVNNNEDPLNQKADGTFTFSTPLVSGSTYSVTVKTQPASQTCTVSNATGTITGTDVSNVVVNCSTNTYTLGGNVSGLTQSETVTLQDSDGTRETVSVLGNGSSPQAFTFPTALASGSLYSVSVLTQPVGQVCTVNSGQGVITKANVKSVAVTCATDTATIGGSVSGLPSSETVVLQNNNQDALPVNANGPFTFSDPVAYGANYNVTVATQPQTATCTVSSGSGTINSTTPVTSVAVTCTLNETSLSTSTSNLALSVTGITEYGVSGTPSSGVARTITITNTGSATANSFSISFPSWPANTTVTGNTCGATLGSGQSCIITISPGNTATSSCNTTFTAPIPGQVLVSASNAPSVSTNVVVLSYGCIYQGGYVFAFDDTTGIGTSVGGKTAFTAENSVSTTWTTGNNLIFGISETSTTSSPNPSFGQVPGQIACNGNVDGACDTNNVVAYYSLPTTNPPVDYADYSAGLCKETNAGYSDWYLPAICELGYNISSPGILNGCGTSTTPTAQNIQSALVDNALVFPSTQFWASTEYSELNGGYVAAWFQDIDNQVQPQWADDYFATHSVRCVRVLTP